MLLVLHASWVDGRSDVYLFSIKFSIKGTISTFWANLFENMFSLGSKKISAAFDLTVGDTRLSLVFEILEP